MKKLEVKDDKVVRAVEEIKKARVNILINDEQQIENKLVLKKEKIYVLRDKSLKLKIIWLYHDILIAEYGRW